MCKQRFSTTLHACQHSVQHPARRLTAYWMLRTSASALKLMRAAWPARHGKGLAAIGWHTCGHQGG